MNFIIMLVASHRTHKEWLNPTRCIAQTIQIRKLEKSKIQATILNRNISNIFYLFLKFIDKNELHYRANISLIELKND